MLGVASASLASTSLAAPVLNEMVTQSDLGISVRRSVVRAAQFIDRVDGSWEKLSDQYRLGDARKQQAGRPKPKMIPPLQPLDSQLAMQLLESADRAFLQSLPGVSASDLNRQVQAVQSLVRPSFERSGLRLATESLSRPTTAEEFNFVAYCRYKTYIEIFSEQQSSATFKQFQRDLETSIGSSVINLLLPAETMKHLQIPRQQGTKVTRSCTDQWQQAIESLEQLTSAMVARGFAAEVDSPAVDADALAEWCLDGGELTVSLALDGEATLSAQVLLQEQGYRLYPNFCRLGIQAVLEKCLSGVSVTIDDYYMDTDYNSDPDRFQVKELLLNIVLDRSD
ncbi:hypothetical protein MPSEU_000792500 [Mayamaea pseudoterrestris]|nr:hypothetical protein MPSEU_000792500 [Mayamaea pseudoterrestris]